MSKRIVFLDRDNTLNHDLGYLPQKKLMDGVDTAIAKLDTLGFKIFIVSNQAGNKSTQSIQDFFGWLLDEIERVSGVRIPLKQVIYETEKTSSHYKPGLGMFETLAEEFDFELFGKDEVFSIGNSPRDLVASNSLYHSVLITGKEKTNPKYICASSIDDAVNYIVYFTSLDRSIEPRILPLNTLYRKSSGIETTTNGCFDLIHLGHLLRFEEDPDCVLVNSDFGYTRNRKRSPAQGQLTRACQVAHLAQSAYVSIFDDPTPAPHLQRLTPTYHLVGEEYKDNCFEEKIVEEAGGQVVYMPRFKGLSSSDLKHSIRRNF